MLSALLLASMVLGPDGRDCAAITGTDYVSDAERAFYWETCLGQPLHVQALSISPLPPSMLRIRRCESSDNYQAISPGGTYRGAYQFDLPTWASVGGSGDPALASIAEQDMRAMLLYQRAGTAPWPVCRWA